MKPICVILLVCFLVCRSVLCFSLEPAMNYSVIERTGKLCPGRDTCQANGRQTRGPELMDTDWKTRNCFCDDLCAVFGDCCIDAAAFNPEQQMQNHLKFECVNMKQYGDVYVFKKSCMPHHRHMEPLCNAQSSEDPFLSTPVTNRKTGITYANHYCATCNGEHPDELQVWQPRLECPSLTGYAQRFHNLSLTFIQEQLKYDKDRDKWGVNFDTGGVPVFHECFIDPFVPDTLTDRIRPCSGKNPLVSCPDDYPHNNTVKSLCESYTALVFEPNKAYRNVHCALCHNASLENLICFDIASLGRFNWQPYFSTSSFAVLFDLSGDTNDTVGFKKSPCGQGELFDPFFKKCRTVFCPQPNHIFKNSKCVESPEGPLISTSTSTSGTSTSTSSTTTSSTSSTTTSGTTPEKSTSTPTTVSSSSEANNHTSIWEEVTLLFPGSSTEFIEEITDDDDDDDNDTTTTLSPAPKPISESELLFQACPKFQLQTDEYKMLDDGNEVYIARYDQTLHKGQFLLTDNQVLLICATVGVDKVGKFDDSLSYVTIICLGISVICLLLHMVATFFCPEFQNLSGKNLFSLCLALLGSYITFISSMFYAAYSHIGCYALAVCMYFFFMASFSWMLVIAFDVFRTLKLATTRLRLTAGPQWKKFAAYSIFGWLVPVALVIIAVLIDRIGTAVPGEYRPGFAEAELCWFSHKKALMAYFAIPFAIIMGINVFLFLCSACMVFDTTKTGSKMAANGAKSNFHLYLRLAVIMGLAWIIGLAAGFVNSSPLWYAFVILNALQGLFIFVAFTCTKKVLINFKDRFCKSKNSQPPFPGYGNRILARIHGNLIQSNIRSEKTSQEKGGTLSSSLTAMDSDPDRQKNSTPSRYGSRSKTMYTLSSDQANCSSYQNSFDARYY